MRTLLVLFLVFSCLYAVSAGCACEKAIHITSNEWWLSEATTGNVFGPYPFAQKAGPYMTSTTVYQVLPQAFGTSPFVGKSAILSLDSFGGLGKPRPKGSGFGVLNVTVESVACFEYNGFTHTFAQVHKTLQAVPSEHVAGAIGTLSYLSDATFSQDCQIISFNEYVNTLCTLCLLAGPILGVCDACVFTSP